MEIEFEEITEKNISALTDIYNYYVKNTTFSYAIKEVSDEQFAEYYKIFDAKTISKAIVADGNIAGFWILRPFNSKKEAFDGTYEYSAYLKPDCCNKGIGKSIFNKIECEYIVNKGINVVIGSICSENIASCKMCEALGFERCGHFKNVGKKFGRYIDLYYYQKIYL